MKIEKQIQEKMLHNFTHKNALPNNQAVYQKLIFYRFEEIVKNLASRFCSLANELELENSLRLFISHSAKSTLAWQILKEYRQFVKKQKLFPSQKYLYDILFVECTQLDILMQTKPSFFAQPFLWNNHYKLAKWAKIAKLSCNIASSDVETKESTHILIHYDFTKNTVSCRQINAFLYTLLKRLNVSLPLQKHMNFLCEENSISVEEAKRVLSEPIEELVNSKVIMPI